MKMTINCQYEQNCRAYNYYLERISKSGFETRSGAIRFERGEYHCVAIDKGDNNNFNGCAHLTLLNLLNKLAEAKVI